MIPRFTTVDCGCLMFETESARWIIQHPRNGYKETISKKWDAIVEHPTMPHSMPLKFIGSYKSKNSAIKGISEIIQQKGNYNTLKGIENEFYKQDYTSKK